MEPDCEDEAGILLSALEPSSQVAPECSCIKGFLVEPADCNLDDAGEGYLDEAVLLPGEAKVRVVKLDSDRPLGRSEEFLFRGEESGDGIEVFVREEDSEEGIGKDDECAGCGILEELSEVLLSTDVLDDEEEANLEFDNKSGLG